MTRCRQAACLTQGSDFPRGQRSWCHAVIGASTLYRLAVVAIVFVGVLAIRYAAINGDTRARDRQSAIASKLESKGATILWRDGYPDILSLFDADFEIAEVSDADAEMIAELTYLRSLTLCTGPPNFHNAAITDKTLKRIRGLERLRSLYLTNTAITDHGLEHLKKMESLERLSLSGTRITDEGLRKLASLKNLRTLYLVKTRVTSEAVRRLSAALPECSIRTTSPHTSEETKQGTRPNGT